MSESASFPTALAVLGILIKNFFFANLTGEKLYLVSICIFIILPNIT